MTFAALLEDVIARLVAAREEADHAVRDRLLADLEEDVLCWLERQEAT